MANAFIVTTPDMPELCAYGIEFAMCENTTASYCITDRNRWNALFSPGANAIRMNNLWRRVVAEDNRHYFNIKQFLNMVIREQ